MNQIINGSGRPWITEEEIAAGIPESKEGWRGERSLYKYITDNLPREWTVIYDRTFDAGKQSAQIDFLVFVPGKGVMNVDAKGPGFQCVNGVVSFKGMGEKDVFKEAERGIHVFDRYVREKITGGASWGAFNKLVFFTEDIFAGPLPGGVPYLQASDMENPRALETAIGNCLDNFSWCFKDFYFWGNRIVDFLCENVKSAPVAWDQIAMDVFSRSGLDQEQQEICYLIENGRYVHVRGGAGTGKTLIAMALAKEAAAKGKKALYVCFNSALAKSLQREWALLPREVADNLIITNFHRLGQKLLSKDYTVITNDGFDRGATDTQIKANLAKDLRRRGGAFFDVAMIDEAQDLTNDNIFTILTLLKSQRRVGIFSDSKQAIFSRVWQLDSTMFDSEIVEKTLNRNYRNTDKIFKTFQVYSGENTIPMIRTCDGFVTKDVSSVSNDDVRPLIERMLANGVRPSDIALITTSDDLISAYKKAKAQGLNGANIYFKDKLDTWFKNECILCTTIQAFKGLEAKIVFFFTTPDVSDELKYTGESRARFELYLVECCRER